MPSSACVHKTLIGLGITEMLLGLGIFGAGIICTLAESRLHELYHGLWGGAIFMGIGLLSILGGAKQSRGCQMAHMILVILACIFLNPTLSTLFMGELSDDAFFTYHEDPAYCRTGCTPNSEYEYDRSSQVSVNGVLLSSYTTPGCESPTWERFCHPNERAAQAEMFALFALFLIFFINIISASFACCGLCRCCGAGAPATTAAIYPVGAHGAYGGPPGAYPGYGYSPMGGMGGHKPGGVHVPIYPDTASVTQGGPYRPPSNYLGGNADARMPTPAKPQQSAEAVTALSAGGEAPRPGTPAAP